MDVDRVGMEHGFSNSCYFLLGGVAAFFQEAKKVQGNKLA